MGTPRTMYRAIAFTAVVASAAAFAPAGVAPSLRAANTAVCASKFPQQSPAGAPPADLFNIWRDDYMLTPSEAAAEAAERQANTFFDGVLPPFSNIGNTERGDILDAPSLRGVGLKADFSTANPTSAYDTQNFGKVEIFNKDVLKNPITGEGPEVAAKKTLAAAAQGIEEGSYASRSLSNFARWRKGEETNEVRRFDLQRPK